MMDIFFHHRYYKINRMFLSVLGVWPYQSRFSKYTRTTFFTVLVMSQVIPQILAVIKASDDPDTIIEAISPFVTDLACITKGVNLMLNNKRMFKLLERMRDDWTSLADEPEIEILHCYAHIGRQFSIAYAITIFSCLAIFMVQPVVPTILESLKVINESGPATLPFPMDYYGFDTQGYFYYTFVHVSIVSAIGITTIIAADTMFLVYVQHACGMFTVVGNQLKRMTLRTVENEKLYTRAAEDPAFRYVVNCIKTHKKTIELGELIEATHTWAFFSFIGFNMIMMSVTGYQMVAQMSEKPEAAIRFAAFTVAETVHLFFQSFFAQRLKDHSERIREHVYQAQWHSTSLNAQKLLSLVIMRTNVPCQLTAGKFFALTLENFTVIVKTSMSYCTILRSME